MSVQTIIAPSHIGQYKFKRTIGEGAFSVVKLAYDQKNEQFFACKIVPKSSLNSEDLEQRFEVEIRINQQLHHPGIVQIIDLLRDEMNFYIFMEFCPNGELFKYIVDRGRLTEDEAKLLLIQVLKALVYVHSIGIAHRDLKPENLLFDPIGKIKISDFGLSRFVGYGGLVETPCGSPCYASPECLSGDAYDGRKSDMWSLGVILYAMVTGQLPWTKRNQAQLFLQIRSGEYTIPEFLSPDCKQMISRLMDVNSVTRITAEEALKLPWVQNVNSEVFNDVENQMQIVSLKKVDAFFNKEQYDLDFSFLKRSDEESYVSQRPTDYKFVVDEIKHGNERSRLPSLITRERKKMYMSQPISNASPGKKHFQRQSGMLEKAPVIPKLQKQKIPNFSTFS